MTDRLLLPTFFCPKPWEGMSGDQTTRFCSYCRKHVHNLEAMSAGERLALLSSPAGSICARYRIAIRRPAKGKEESYARHLLKYGAGVAVAGSVLLTFWEMHERDGRGKFYRLDDGHGNGHEMPGDLYEERSGVTLGMMVATEIEPPPSDTLAPEASDPPPPIDVKLDPLPLHQLENPLRPEKLAPKVAIPL